MLIVLAVTLPRLRRNHAALGGSASADKPYGQRELLIVAPDGNLIAFGQAIATGPSP